MPRTNVTDSSAAAFHQGQIAPVTSSLQISSGTYSRELAPLPSKPVLEKKAEVYGEVVKDLNSARECGSLFKVRKILFAFLIKAIDSKACKRFYHCPSNVLCFHSMNNCVNVAECPVQLSVFS